MIKLRLKKSSIRQEFLNSNLALSESMGEDLFQRGGGGGGGGGAYFPHAPRPPPPPPSLQVVFAQSLIAISVFPWNFTWNLPQCEVAIIFAKNIILDMYRGYFRVVTNISFKIKERAQRVIYFLLTETNKIISPSLHVIFFLLSDGHERYLVNLVLQ